MGCISSKILARSISLHEERKKGTTQRTRSKNGIPLLEDIIISANTTSDHYLALVLHSRSFSSSNAASKLAIIDDEPPSSETIDKLEISSTSLAEEGGGGKQIGTTVDQRKRSKSCSHLFLPEHDFPSLSQENSSGFDVGSRSFHTVEEYDDLVRKLGFHTEDKDSSAFEDKIIVPSQKHDVSIDKGNKRKAMSKRLGSLKIPSSNNIECPAIGSLREWIPPSGNNIYSPGSYVTPKFGSYSSSSQMDSGGKNSAGESSEDGSIFSPELVSVFEECMQKLEADEEKILKQIMENFEEENNGGEMKWCQITQKPKIKGSKLWYLHCILLQNLQVVKIHVVSASVVLKKATTCTKSAGSAMAMNCPSDVKRIDRIAPRLPLSTATDFDKFRTSQTRQVLSWFPVAKIRPLGCHADAKEKSKCPHKGKTVYKHKQN
ncbi:uncharacterized protein G2W53_040407 [Senna tora]|uniref:Uncharacterized protein n=1 Tax=Senna tora TaxID=362788 RepID=A0A834SE14_9FABA|nr:uncharacterized protein G2W53_040407 [Senna tora]